MEPVSLTELKSGPVEPFARQLSLLTVTNGVGGRNGTEKQEQHTGTCKKREIKGSPKFPPQEPTMEKSGGIRLNNRAPWQKQPLRTVMVHTGDLWAPSLIFSLRMWGVPVTMIPLPCSVSVPNMFPRSISAQPLTTLAVGSPPSNTFSHFPPLLL